MASLIENENEITVKGYTTGILYADEDRLDFVIKTNHDRPSSSLGVTFNKSELLEFINKLQDIYTKMI